MLAARVLVKPQNNSRTFSTSSIKRSETKTPLSEYFPGTPETGNNKPQPASINKTTLDNGLNVITRNVTGAPISNLSLFVEAGSRYENKYNAGTSHFISQLGFRDTTKSSELLRVRLLESTGADLSVSAGRENITYNLEGLSGVVPTVLNDFFEALYPRLHRLDVEDERENIKRYTQDFVSSPDLVVNETLHQVAFGSRTLGNSLVCPPHNINISNKLITEFMDNYYHPNRMTLVALNYDHSELVDMAKEAMGDKAKGTQESPNPASYVGGEVFMNELRVAHPEENLKAHVALGFKGSEFKSSKYAALAVLQSIIGSGSSQYRGTTRDANTRLGRIASESSSYLNASTFNMNYSDAGLFGVHAIVDPHNASKSITSIVDELAKTASSVSESELGRAKNVAKLNFLSSMERRHVMVDALYRQSRIGDVSEEFTANVLQQIDSIDLPTVKQVAEETFKSKPSYVAYGDLYDLPDAQDVSKQLS
eukprot:gb/GECH01011086.1/.p1 GENE.gb/GECH01011086.1/~~gb/GECH01011086.1/.p1  ORF type:complete len:481 (+),score=120.02 gb/GECH01011086.1/:1-1443(+)